MTATPVVSPHLVRAFFGRADGRAPGFALEGLRAHDDVTRVYPGLAERMRSLGAGDAGVRALVAVPQPVVSIERG